MCVAASHTAERKVAGCIFVPLTLAIRIKDAQRVLAMQNPINQSPTLKSGLISR